MSEEDLMAQFIDAYDTRTGEKLPNQVPEHFPDLYDHLSRTPKSKATEKARTTTTKES
jgi:hypothetical protein